MKGLLVSFDGIDSSGKATQAKMLTARIKETGRAVGFWQTPDYSTESGIKLKELFQGRNGSWDYLGWQEKMKLLAANRVEHKQEVVNLLQSGGVVVYDRYVPSSIAHMTVDALGADEIAKKRQSIQAQVEEHEYVVNGMPRESLSIFLNVPPQKAADLLTGRKKKLAEADEATDNIGLQRRIYEEYLWLVANFPERFVKIDCLENDKLLDINEIADKVWQVVLARFHGLTVKD